ncbi:glycosyltransferase family 2 protein [Hydrocarboniphaga sp.]|uniref:glycosyltransferase family 2 protein n=1 Tax=Hydrocarboniphaga sp. TaxID=2033016 RepID=UPI002ABCE85E|nr:glycosyltransferase family 2 protein [Hydrocarboniphaga sp.]MDZ4078361.1 glycosyltransferase family 2 protein [Hydrocarboniphaga sp.]
MIDIVIVNWNGRAYCEDLLPQILEHWKDSVGKVVVVDNDSKDGSQDAIAKHFPWVTLVCLPQNVGYAKGNNAGIALCNSPIVLLLNNDTKIIDPYYLHKISSRFQENSKLAVWGGKLILKNGRFQTGAAGFDRGLLSFFTYFLFLSRLFPESSAPFYIDQKAFSKRTNLIYVDWISGASMAVNRKTLLEIGGVPEDYFMYAEDIKLCRSVREKGLSIAYDPTASIVHFHGGSETTLDTKTRWIDSTLSEYSRDRGSVKRTLAKLIFGVGFALRAAIYKLLSMISPQKESLSASYKRMVIYMKAALR